jgi:hypothetical protein
MFLSQVPVPPSTTRSRLGIVFWLAHDDASLGLVCDQA